MFLSYSTVLHLLHFSFLEATLSIGFSWQLVRRRYLIPLVNIDSGLVDIGSGLVDISSGLADNGSGLVDNGSGLVDIGLGLIWISQQVRMSLPVLSEK